MKKISKFLSVVLSFLMIMGIFSVSNPVFAAEIQNNEHLTQTIEQFANRTDANDFAVEIISERDKYTKVFQNVSGTKTAVVSATPIHYETENGWENIDNTLIEFNEITGEVYKNKKNDFTTTIPKELSSNKKVQIEKEGYSLSFELVGTDVFSKSKKIKGTKKSKSRKHQVLENGVETDFLDKTSAVSFENVGENTSVEYAVTSTGLKENIILNGKPTSEVTYKYIINAKKLDATLNNDNSIVFKNSDEQAIFEIPAPIMYDANNIISDDIDVNLTGKNGKYTLIYKPSYEWLSGDVEYPVVIDPVINSANEDLGIKDAVVCEGEPTTNYGDIEFLYTCKSDTGDYLSYIDLSTYYILKNGAKIKSVLLSLYYTGGIFVDNDTTIAAYTVTSDWSESTVTYNTKPTTINSLIDRRPVSEGDAAKYITFDVTKAYTINQDTYGVCIRQRDAVESEVMTMFASSEHPTASQQPYFTIEYYESQGVEEQFDYHAFDVGRAGTAYFNDFTEQIYIERDELGLSGINMPVQIKRYFNSGFGGTNSMNYYALSGFASPYGFGWRTNYNQMIEYHDEIDGKEHILYCNGDGQTTYFEKTDTVSEGVRTWKEVADIFSNTDGYTLYLPSTYDGNVANKLQYATIKDSSGQVYEFNSYGLLTKINTAEENSENCINISYTSDNLRIDKITDGVGREYRFTYTEYEDWLFPLLTSIQAFSPSGSAITVTNDSGTSVPYKMTYTYEFSNYCGTNGLPILASATYPDGETVYYTANENLISLKNIDGYSIEFNYLDTSTVISEKVYNQSGTSQTEGGVLTVTYVNAYEKTFSDKSNVEITEQGTCTPSSKNKGAPLDNPNCKKKNNFNLLGNDIDKYTHWVYYITEVINMNIREMRNALGDTQSEFAARYNIPFRTIQNWEAGVRNPPEYVINLLESRIKADLVNRKTVSLPQYDPQKRDLPKRSDYVGAISWLKAVRDCVGESFVFALDEALMCQGNFGGRNSEYIIWGYGDDSAELFNGVVLLGNKVSSYDIKEKNGLLFTDFNRTVADALANEDILDMQGITEALSRYYYTNGDSFEGIFVAPEYRDRFTNLAEEAIGYYES